MSGQAEINNRSGIEIAVIGMSGRFPGAKNISEFWENLKNGVESISFLSDEEINESTEARNMQTNPNYVNSRGGILENMEYFDAYFFGYTPLEAEIMDPQTRFFHECAWEALENAGYTPGFYTGLIGLYAGAASHFNWEALSKISGKSSELGEFAANLLAGSSFLCTNVSYKFGLKGPAVSVQSACSTSLVAIHLACQAILNGECDMALAGGVSVNSVKRVGYLYKEGMIDSRDGRCRAFDSKASGCIGGSGVGIVVLKLLDHALEDSDHLYAVIKGSAINNDGNRKSGYTAPSVEGQSEVIIAAQQVSEVPLESITYVETHGTGTILGDPIEIAALKRGFNTDKKNFCALGSVKTNIGHLNTAAGVTGFIKTILALKHRLIPPSLNFDTSNPEIDFENSPFFVNKTLRDWKSNGYPLRAGVSSFGIGGTNAHIVLEEAPKPDESSESRAFQLLLISAKTESALDIMSKSLAEYLKNNPGINLADMSFTLNAGRSAFDYRHMIVCSDVNEAITELTTSKSKKIHTLIVNSENIPVVFVFSGLGSQYVNMGLDLYKTEALFRSEMDRCFEIAKSLLGYDIKHILYPDIDINTGVNQEQSLHDRKLSPNWFNRFEVAQVVVFIFEYALAQLLIEWGIRPQAMIGYSFGEISAACLAGVFSLEDTLKMIVSRGQLIQKIPEGAMLSVPLPFDEVKSLISEGVSIAIDNGLSCIVSGSEESIATFEEKMKKKRQICMRLKASMAIHSGMMEPILKEFEDRLKKIKLNNPQIPYISNVTGTWMTDNDAKNPAYWKRHLRETVRFSAGIRELIKREKTIFVEIGAGVDISALLARYIENNPGQHVISIIRPSMQKVSDDFYLLNKIGVLWLWGVKINWSKFYSREKRYRLPLPSYPFEGKRYWIDGNIFEWGTGIMKEKAQSTTSADMSDWFYLPSWKRFSFYPALQKIEKKSVKYNWLIFVIDLNLGKLIIKRLEKEGHTIVVVKAGNGFEREDKKTYTINLEKSGNYEDLFNELRRLKVFPDKILQCWGLTGENYHCSEMKSFDEFQYRGFYSLLYIVKAIGKKIFSNSIEITVLTDQLHEVVGGELLCPAKATILGLINSIPQEYPGIRCVNIDILLPEPGTSEEEALIDTLLEELTGRHHEPVVAIRNNNRWIRIFEPLHLGPELKNYAKLRKNGVYLITGGLGNIGLMLSELLARRAGARLVLTGRSQFPPKDEFKIKKLRQIEALGGQVLYIQVDASNLEQMREVILRTWRTFGTINGVIHCAGITRGPSITVIQNLSPDDCRLQFQAKAYGAAVLEELLEDKELDFAWMLSSISCFLGGLGLAAYAAANIFMDTLARCLNQRKKKRHHWFSLNWDGMEAEKSIEIFERLLSLEKIDQTIFSEGGNLQGRFDRWIKLEQVNKQVRNSGEIENKPKGHPRPFLANKYVPPQNREEREITSVWERILGIDGIGANDNFLELGGDSLKAITMLAALQKKMNVKIPLAEIFKTPSIRELSEFIKKSEEEKYSAIEPVEKKEYYLLSSAQKRIYFLQQMSLNSTAYNISEIIPLTMEFAGGKIEDTFKKLIKRHESLRTSFHMVKDTPVQRVHEDVIFNLQLHVLNGSYSSQDFIRHVIRPFDLTNAPLIRVALLKEVEKRCILIVDMHHIISDGVSHGILVSDFQELYEEELLLLRIQYKDFSEWQDREKEKENFKCQGEYWLKEFAGEIRVLEIPYDYPRPVVQSFEGHSVNFEMTGEEIQGLKALALTGGSTLFMVLVAVVNIFLSKISGQEDIIIGTPVAGRRHIDLHNIMGVFVNTLALRNYPASEKTFKEFLNEVKVNALKAFENQEYQFEDLIDKVSVNRDMSRNPLFDVMFVLQNVDNTRIDIPGLKMSPYQYDNKTSKFDLTLSGVEAADKLLFTFEYSTKLFAEATIARFIAYFKRILSQVLNGSRKDMKLSEITIISAEEKRQILFDFNDTKTRYPQDKSIHRLFEEQVEKNRDHTALVGPSVYDTSVTAIQSSLQITYRELDEKSNRLTQALQSKGTGPDTIVGIMVERSIEIIIGIMGILKSSGAYLPIDPIYPINRIGYMLKDSEVKVLVTTSALAAEVEILGSRESNKNLEILFLENLSSRSRLASGLPGVITSPPPHLPLLPGTGSQQPTTSLAYVIYTSGTTGWPKGVLIEHRNVVRLLFTEKFQFDFSNRDIWTMFHSFCFDFSVWEMYGALLYGGKLLVIPKITTRDMERYLDTLKKGCVTVLNQTPSAFFNLSNLELNSPRNELSTRYVIFGGEALSVPRLKDWKSKYPGTKLINMYGITETTVHVTFKELKDSDIQLNISNIGKSIPTLSTYVIDKNLELLPVGVAGELCVGGEGVGRGYLNKPELSREKFIENPYKVGERLYKSGDLVKLLPMGDIQYFGRIDRQVKIRGFRIELGEIESCLLKHEALIEVVVVQKKDKIGDKFLCAYYVADHALEGDSLKQFLAKDLPGYMVPSFFVQIEKIPLNSNGKLDPGALPHPIMKIEKLYVAPQNDIEKSLVKIWADILGIQEQGIGINANFFKIGGHSLKAVTLASKIQKEFNVELPLSEIFVEPTIGSMAAKIGQKHETKHIPIKSVEKKDFYSLSSAQKRFYLLQHLEPTSTALNMVRVYQFEGRMEEENLVRIFRQLIHRHEALRTSFYFLNDGPVQRIHPTVHFKLQTDNCTGNDINDYVKKFVRPFDLSRAPLLRVMLLQTGTEHFFLLFDIHHIICDGVSMDILITDFITLYRGESLKPLTHHYRDYVTWEKEFLFHEKVKLLENYWLEKLDGFTFTGLPIDHYKTNLPILGNNLRLKLDTVISHKIEQFCNRHAITKFTFFMAVLNIVLAIEIDQRDITIAIPIVNRNHHQLDSIIGLFLNVLLIRNEVQLKGTFEANLERVKQTVIEAMDNHLYPYELLKQEIRERRNWKENELFSILFNYFLVEQSSQKKFEPFRTSSVGSEVLVPKYDITLYISDYGDLIDFNVVYKGNIYSDIRIQRLLEDCKNVIFKIIEDGQILVQDILAQDNGVPMEFRGDHNQFDEMDDLLL